MIAGLLMAGAAQAADLPTKAPVYKAQPAYFNWTGFYIGINGGGAWGHTDWRYNFPGSPGVHTFADHRTHGALFGGTVGYNWQFSSPWVLGVEADFDWADINGSTSCPNPAFSCQSKIRSLGTARGRLGYAVDRVLFYGTGGLAFGDVRIQTVTIPGGVVAGSSHESVGWSAGAGIEWAIVNNWSFKVEYLHYDLGTHNFLVDAPAAQNVDALERGNIIRAGLNWRFGGRY